MTDRISASNGARARRVDDSDDAPSGGRADTDHHAQEARRAAALDRVSTFAPQLQLTGAAPRPTTGLPPSVAAVVHPERSFVRMAPLATEVLRLRAELAKTSDPLLRTALATRARQLSDQWCAMARAAGMKPPAGSFDPFHASDDELRNAVLWTEVGNTFPVASFGHPVDVQRFRDDVLTAMTLRTPGLLDRVIAANPRNPALVPLLEEELRRLGDTSGCRPGDTVESLLARRAELLSAARAKADEADRSRKYIGLDGRIGTAEDLASYETEQYILAVNPGTTMGSLLAATAAASGGDVEAIRRAGSAGNQAERLGGGFGKKGDPKSGQAMPPRW